MHMLVVALVIVAAGSGSSEPEKRYGQTADLKKYPQDAPKAALSSFIKSIENKDIEYFLAQLADPKFVDQRLKDLGGKFDEVVKEARQKLVDEPNVLKLLQKLAEDGEWKIEDDSATLTLKAAPDKPLNFVKRSDRWFVENRYAR